MVRDPDGPHVARCGAGGFQCIQGRPLDRCPNLLGIVLDPTRLRVVLSNLCVALAANAPIQSDGDSGGAGRSLVEAEDYSSLSHR